MITHFGSQQFFKFLLVGGLAAIANFSSRIFYSIYTSFSTAVVFAYLTGMVVAYCLSKRFVFQDSVQPLKKSVVFFILVNLVALLQTFVITMFSRYYILPSIGLEWRIESISHALGICFPVFTSYLGHKYFSFGVAKN